MKSTIKVLLNSVLLIYLLGMVTTTNTYAQSAKDFNGVNWADGRDNYVDGWLILCGLEASDDYTTVKSFSKEICKEFKTDLGANTIRIPINPNTALESWWDSYRGVLDGALNQGMKVIICYWEGSNKDGYIDNLNDFWKMWDVVTKKYQNKNNVYFEVFNEPHGYSTSELKSLYSDFISRYNKIPLGRIVLGGTNYCDYVREIGGDFPDCLLSQHIYAFWYSQPSSDAWAADLNSRVGDYASRTIVTEYGAFMTTGINYNGSENVSDPNESNMIKHIVGISREIHDSNLGSCYWPGIRDGDWYRLCDRSGSSLTVTNQSGLDHIQYGWNISTKSAKIANQQKLIFASDIILTPNPANEFLNIQTEIKNYSVLIYNNTGQLMLKLNNLNGQNTIETGELSKGVYLVNIKSMNNNVIKKIVIQ